MEIPSSQFDRNLTPRQCAILEVILETVQQYFHANGKGLKKSYLEKSQELISLHYALSLYTQTTDALLKTFVTTQTKQNDAIITDIYGNINLEVVFTPNPSAGENKLSVKVIACSDLKWSNTGSFKPFVEVHLIGPHLSDKKRKFATKTKTNTNPKFMETFNL